MRTIQAVLAGVASFFAAFALSACGAPDTEPVTAMIHATIIHAEEGNVLFLPSEPDGTILEAGDIYSAGIGAAAIVDEEGNALTPGDLAAGQIVDVIYDGSVQESYPARITCSEVRLVGQQPEGWQCPVDLAQFFNQPDDGLYANMPSMGVEYSAEGTVSYMPTVRGTSSWYEDGEGICVDSVLPVHEEARERIPEIQAVEDFLEMKLDFSKEPEVFSVTCWDWEDFAETGLGTDPLPVSMDGALLTIPGEGGSYLYEVRASWEEGDVTYYFTVNCP